MTPGTIVVALGGNAVAPPGVRPSIANQFRHTRSSLGTIVELARAGWRIAIVHGNGPQVGDELLRNEIASDQIEPLPLGVLVAATAGWMGYMIQQSLQNALAQQGVARATVTLVTQTLCDAYDPDLRRPTKPIGHPLDLPRLARMRQRGEAVAEERPGRWRRMAPSPRPQAIVEGELVRRLVDGGTIVISSGGGGPPVYRDQLLGLEGIDAVVDKDRTAATLAHTIGARTLLMLTNVEAVFQDFGAPQQQPLRRLTLAQADQLVAGGSLGGGSMRPKVEAAADFVRQGGEQAVIAELSQGLAALAGRTGTTIVGDTAS